ncbi:hypothetical protein FKN04_12240 [Bacillus glycinifermentans]|uniref:hypothetical protein n=1 Tax=Bacillus glycinifermentans TaxID=1664069 RepID=UPI0015824233|nr:hypothetical protein [Bacillus glycinifermentans]NUJ17349.1 hypothetical protein [Bacillus glycinifermentans]
MLTEKILTAYAEGSPIEFISDSFQIAYNDVLDILRTYKEDSKFKTTFTDEFKKMIAERDINGVPRNIIAKELSINPNTVKKACQQFGQTLKEKAISSKVFTRIEGNFDINRCPSCSSNRVNLVEENTTYCLACGSEYIHKKDHVLKLNFEYLEE